MPVLSSVFESRIQAEKLERLSPTERASTAEYDKKLEIAKAPEVAIIKRFSNVKDPLQKNKFGPVIRHAKCLNMIIYALQFRFHFRGGHIFQEKWWYKTRLYGSVSDCIHSIRTCILITFIQILSTLMGLAHGKLCRVLFDNNKIGTQVPESYCDLMDELDEAFFTSFKPEDDDDRRFGDFAGQYRVAWKDEYQTKALDAFHRLYEFQLRGKDGVPWDESPMKKRLLAELTWCPGYANKGRPLAHNVPFLCSSLIRTSAAILVQFPVTISEVSLPFFISRWVHRSISRKIRRNIYVRWK